LQAEIAKQHQEKTKKIDFIQKLIDQSKKTIKLAQMEREAQEAKEREAKEKEQEKAESRSLLGKTPQDLHIKQLTIDNGQNSSSMATYIHKNRVSKRQSTQLENSHSGFVALTIDPQLSPQSKNLTSPRHHAEWFQRFGERAYDKYNCDFDNVRLNQSQI
jgi:mannitol-specific phosphotransferase system IIBC component